MLWLMTIAVADEALRDHAADTCESPFTMDSDWRVTYTPSAARVQADLLSGTFLMGCEDEFPAMASTQVSTVGTGGMGDVLFGGSKDIVLATYDEVDANAVSNLDAVFGFNPLWWGGVDDPVADDQAYMVVRQSGSDPIVLIVGANEQGLRFGVIDFLKSLDEVVSASSWSPDPTSPLGGGEPA
jgi:hypothetical protein